MITMAVEYSPIKWIKAYIKHSPSCFRIRVLNKKEREERDINYPVAYISILELGLNPKGEPGPYRYREQADMLIKIKDLIELGQSLKQLPDEE